MMGLLTRDVIYGANSTAFTVALFEPVEAYLERMLWDVASKAIKIKELKFIPQYLRIGTEEFVIFPPNEEAKFPGILQLPKQLQPEADEFLATYEAARNDLKFIQMWLAMVHTGTIEEQRAKMPSVLAKQITYWENIPCNGYKIPKGKEKVWKHAEEVINFCLGIKLLI